MGSVDVRRGGLRSRTRATGLDSRHSFSFGRHYDPADTGFGVLVAHNDELVQPGAGFAAHPHRDTEVLTWVLQGTLTHEDSAGHRGTVPAGVVQRMTAGSGVVHSERNDGAVPVRLVQMWVLPDETGLAPGYAQADVTDALRGGGLVPVAAGLPGAPVSLACRSAALHVARLQPGESVFLPLAASVHLYVALGTAALQDAGPLAAGDAVRLTATGGQTLTATDPAEVLVWEMHAT